MRRLSVAQVYWVLLVTSAVSSALLFLIVASENIQNNKFSESKEQLESDGQEKSHIKISTSLKNKIKENNFSDKQIPISASFDITNKKEELKNKIPDEIEILKESLSQQPNLSQGISDGGQPVLLTLVDTAASLQSLASNRAEFRSKQTEGNVSVDGSGASATADKVDEDELVDPLAVQFSEALLETNSTNGTGPEAQEPEVQVVVVRAEQKRASSIRDQMIEEQRDKLPLETDISNVRESQMPDNLEELTQQQLPKSPTPAPELNDSAARARLNAGPDDGGAVMIDGLVTAGPSDPPEDIPSFNEWAQKWLEEAEKKKTAHPNASVQTPNGTPSRSLGGKMRTKNYASPDCGAKVVAATPESGNVRNILVASRDEYMLNACTSRVWFVVELCEAIQARKIELANFELFSSSPKNLSVYVSDRFPTRDWTLVGQFMARDQRDIQSFQLEPRLFGKFIKVELHSHYGSEHFCPISLFRAYGTSEFEVLETETESDTHVDSTRPEITEGDIVAAGSDVETDYDSEEDKAFADEEGKETREPSSSNPLLAMIGLLRKTVEILIKSTDFKPTNNITKIQESINGDVLRDDNLDDCGTPMYNIACRDCDDKRFGRVFQLISCKRHYLESLVNLPFIQETLAKSHLCGSSFGFDVVCDSEAYTDKSKEEKGSVTKYFFQAQFLSSIFTPDYIIALCNVLAAREQRLFANISHQEQQSDKIANKTRSEETTQMPLPIIKDEKIGSTSAFEASTSDGSKVKVEATVTKPSLDTPTVSINLSESLATQIKPTKTTVTNDEAKGQSFSQNLESSKTHVQEETSAHQSETLTTAELSPPTISKRPTTQKSSPESQEKVLPRDLPPTPSTTSKSTQSTESATKVNEKIAVASETVEPVAAKVEETQEAKSKVEPEKAKEKVEFEPKITSQEQLNFESFDFKDLEVDNGNGYGNGNGNGKNDASIIQQTASTPQQKESVFLRLSNRIKALERNMSLSGQYLEELSRRYKKQVEEMQRTLERAMTAMNEESRKGEERESKRLEEVAVLRSQIGDLTKLLDNLVSERNSWRPSFFSLAQHALFILFDVVLVILILFYCRRADDDGEYEDEKDDVRLNQRIKRGKSYEIVKQKCSQLTKKTKKRRPSEIASQVTGTYDQLMIDDSSNASQLSKKDKKKKRKKDTLILRTSSVKETSSSKGDVNSQLPSRSASANDALNYGNHSSSLSNLNAQKQRPDSAPDASISYFGHQQSQQQFFDRRVQVIVANENRDDSIKGEDESRNNPDDMNISSTQEDDVFEPEHSIYSSFRKKLSSPSFMKTALGSRSKRISFSGSSSKKLSQSLDESAMKPLERRYNTKMDSLSELEINNGTSDEAGSARTTNGFVDESDESRSSCATPTNKKKKTSGLKKMVRRFF